MAAYCQLCGVRDPSTGGILCRSCQHMRDIDKNNYGITETDDLSTQGPKTNEWAYIQRMLFEMERDGKTQAEIDAKIAEFAKTINDERRERRKNLKIKEEKQANGLSAWLKRRFSNK